jgi:hypothetical protein
LALPGDCHACAAQSAIRARIAYDHPTAADLVITSINPSAAEPKRKALRVALISLLLLFVAWSAQAKLLTWTLQDVRFDDGGTAGGFFVFDPETIEFDQQNQEWIATPPTIFDIVTTGSVVGGEFHYQPPRFSAFICDFCSNFGMYFGSFLILALEFDAPLPVAGGTVPLGGVEFLF